MKKSKKIAGAAVACALAATVAIGGTLAYLTAQTETITNTFTVGNVKIALAEDAYTDAGFKMIPGQTITKDPKVSVEEGSENTYLYVEVTKSNNFDDYLTMVTADGWEILAENSNILWREVASDATPREFNVLKDNQVMVNGEVTQEQMDAITNGNVENPTLSFKAYGVQKDGFKSAQDAWNKTFGAPKQPGETTEPTA